MVKTIETYPKKLINVDNSKKLQEVLGKEETQKLLQKNYEKYKKLEEKIHILNKTQLDISKLKNELTGDIDERADKLLNLIEKEEKSIEYQTRKKFEEKQEKIKNELREKADKKIPFIGAMLFDWASDLMKPLDKNADGMDKFFGKIGKYFGTMFLGWLGLKEGFNKLQILKAEDNNDEKKEEKKSTNSEQVDNSPEEINQKSKVFSKLGFNFLKVSTGVELDESSNTDTIAKQIQNVPYKRLNSIFNGCFLNGKPDDNKIKNLTEKFPQLEKIAGLEGKQIFDVLSIYMNNYANIIYKQNLSEKKLKQIFINKNGRENLKYINLIGKENYENLKKSGYSYKILDLSTINILLTLSISNLFYIGVDKLKKYGIDLYNFIKEDSETIGEIKEYLKDKKENLLSIKITNLFSFNNKVNFGGPEKVIETDENIKKELNFSKLKDNKEINEFKNLLKFKNQLLSKLSDKKVNLGINGFEEGFKKGINYGKIILLYNALNGNVENFNDGVINKSFFYSWVTEILSIKNNGELAGKYEANLASKIMNSNNTDIFTKEDKLLLRNIGKKGLGIYVNSVEKTITNYEGLASESFYKYLMEPLNISQETSNMLFDVLEIGGVVAFLWAFRKLNIVSKVLIGGSLIGSITLYITSKVKKEDLKKAIGDDMFKKLESEIKGETIQIKTEKGNKNIKINSIQDLYDIKNNPKKLAIKKQVEKIELLKGDYVYLGKDGKLHNIKEEDSINFSKKEPIIIKNNEGLYILYKGNKLVFDTQTNYLTKLVDDESGNKDIDKFRGFDLNFGDIKIDLEKKLIKFGGTNFNLKIENIINKLKNGRLKKDFTGKLHYYIIDKTGDDVLVLSY